MFLNLTFLVWKLFPPDENCPEWQNVYKYIFLFSSITPNKILMFRILILSSELSTNVYEIFPFLCMLQELFMKSWSTLLLFKWLIPGESFRPLYRLRNFSCNKIRTSTTWRFKAGILKSKKTEILLNERKICHRIQIKSSLSAAKPIHIFMVIDCNKKNGNITI